MPRKEKTYSSADIVRFWSNNLTNEEQKEIVLFFWTVVPGIYLTNKEVIAIYEEIGKLIKNWMAKKLLKFAIKNMAMLRRFLNISWALKMFDGNLRKEVILCIMKRTTGLEKKSLQNVISSLK